MNNNPKDKNVIMITEPSVHCYFYPAFTAIGQLTNLFLNLQVKAAVGFYLLLSNLILNSFVFFRM